jgi:DNA-binding CsgD family transcriptional regulator
MTAPTSLLNRLSEGARRALRAVSILDTEFPSSLLHLAGLADPASLEEAAGLGILEFDDVVIRFVDPAVLDALRAEVERTPELAFEARRRAAHAAFARLEYADAAAHLGEALRLLPRLGDAPISRGRLLLDLAQARYRSGSFDRAWRACADAAELARASNDYTMLADAATLIRGGSLASWAFTAELHALCREALTLLGDGEPVRRARLAAQLAGTSSPWDRADRRSPSSVPTDCVDAGVDDEARFLDLRARHQELLDVGRIDDRLALADEVMALAAASSTNEYLAWGQSWRLDALYQLGRRVELDAQLMSFAITVKRLREPLWAWRLVTMRASLAFLEARYDETMRLSQEGLELGRACGLAEAPFLHLVSWSEVAVHTTIDLDLVEPAIRAALDGLPFLARGWLALVLLARGQREEAAELWRALAAHLDEQPRNTPEWLIAMAGYATLCVELDDRTTARTVFDRLLPFRDLHVVASTQTPPYGPVSLHLGRLARLLGDAAGARGHLEAAVRHCSAMQAPAFAQQARDELAALAAVSGPLSGREHEVAGLVAERLHLSERTVENHVSSALRKLDVQSRAAIAAWFVRRVTAERPYG